MLIFIQPLPLHVLLLIMFNEWVQTFEIWRKKVSVFFQSLLMVVTHRTLLSEAAIVNNFAKLLKHFAFFMFAFFQWMHHSTNNMYNRKYTKSKREKKFLKNTKLYRNFDLHLKLIQVQLNILESISLSVWRKTLKK